MTTVATAAVVCRTWLSLRLPTPNIFRFDFGCDWRIRILFLFVSTDRNYLVILSSFFCLFCSLNRLITACQRGLYGSQSYCSSRELIGRSSAQHASSCGRWQQLETDGELAELASGASAKVNRRPPVQWVGKGKMGQNWQAGKRERLKGGKICFGQIPDQSPANHWQLGGTGCSAGSQLVAQQVDLGRRGKRGRRRDFNWLGRSVHLAFPRRLDICS